MRRALFFCGFAFLMLYGCIRPMEDKYLEPAIQLLQGQPIKQINDVKMPGVYMQVIDTFLVIFRQNEPLFQVYSTEDYALLGQFGTRGNGPDQFRLPMPIQWHQTTEHERPTFLISDVGKRQVYSVDLIDFSMGKPDYLNSDAFPPANVLPNPLRIFYAQNDYLMGTEAYRVDGPVNRFFIFDKSKQSKLDAREMPVYSWDGELDAHQHFLRTYGEFTFNPYREKIAVLPRNFGQVDFYLLDGSLENSYIFEEQPIKEASSNEANFTSFKMYFMEVISTKDFIIGKTAEEPNKVNNPTLLFRVFDWDGRPIAKWLMEAEDHSYFAYDEKKHQLYLYHAEREHDNLWIYELPSLVSP